MKEFFEKVDFEKISRRQKSGEKISQGAKEIISCDHKSRALTGFLGTGLGVGFGEAFTSARLTA